MKMLVTGGAGFIGSHLVDALISRKHKVIVVDDLSSGFREFVNKKARFEKMHIATPAMEKLILRTRPDVIYHLAAQKDPRLSVDDPVEDIRSNILGLAYMMRAAKELKSLKRFVFASTGGAIYGGAKDIPTPEQYPPRPFSPYGVSKFASELYLNTYDHLGLIPFTALRFANVYGPRQTPKSEAGVISVWTRALLCGKTPIVFGDGKQTRDYVYVVDVIRALLIASRKGRGEVLNIGTGRETSLLKLFRMLRGITGVDARLVSAPAKIGEERRSAIDPRRAKRVLGWSPRTSLEQGLAKTVKWTRDNCNLSNA